MNYTKKQLRNKLIYYLSYYVRKPNLRMKVVIRSILSKLKNDKPISHKQFLSVIKFLEREKEYRHLNQQQLIQLYTPIIYNKDKEVTYEQRSTLEPFFL